MKDWQPRKCWCGVTFEFPMDEEFHDCNNWEHLLEEGEKK